MELLRACVPACMRVCVCPSNGPAMQTVIVALSHYATMCDTDTLCNQCVPKAHASGRGLKAIVLN